MFAQKAEGTLPDKLFYIENTTYKSWQNFYSAYHHAKGNPTQKVLVLGNVGTINRENDALLYAYSKALEQLPNVTLVLACSSNSLYDLIDENKDKFSLFYTRIDEQGKATGHIVSGRFQGSLLKSMGKNAPKEIKQQINETLKKDQSYFGQKNYFSPISTIGQYEILPFLLIIFLLLGMLFFFISRKRSSMDIADDDILLS